MSRRTNPQAVAACLRRAQALVEGTVSDANIPEKLVLEARQEQTTGPAAQALAEAILEADEAARTHRQCEEAQDHAAWVVRHAKLKSNAVAERLRKRFDENPWPEVASLQKTAARLRTEQQELDEELKKTREASEKSMANLNRLSGFSSIVASSLLKARMIHDEPSFPVKIFSRFLRVDRLVETAVVYYCRLGEMDEQSHRIQVELRPISIAIDEVLRTHPEAKAARAEVSSAALLEMKAGMATEEASGKERTAKKKVDEAFKKVWKGPAFTRLAAEVAQLRPSETQLLDNQIWNHYTKASTSKVSSGLGTSDLGLLNPMSFPYGLMWWSILSPDIVQTASPVLQDTAFLSEVVTTMGLEEVSSSGHSHDGSVFSTGGGFGGYDQEQSHSIDSFSPSPLFSDSSSSSSNSDYRSSSSSSFSSGGDF